MTDNTIITPTLPTGYTLTQRPDGLFALKCRWEDGLPAVLKRAGGVWDDRGRAWTYKTSDLDKLAAALTRRAAKTNSPEAVAAREAAALEADRKQALKWIGYVESAATEGRVYDNGVAKLRDELKVARWPELAARLDKAIAQARETRRRMEAQWAAEKAQRQAEGARKHAELAAHRELFPVSDLPELNTPVRRYGKAVIYTGTGKSWYLSGEDGDGWASPECWDTRVCYAYFREATAEEIAALEQSEAEAKHEREAQAEREANLRKAAKLIREHNDRPEHPQVEGVEYHNTRTIYGGGSRYVVGREWIWYCEGNGADGDDWSLNNLPGEIAWRAPYSAELEALAQGWTVLGEL